MMLMNEDDPYTPYRLLQGLSQGMMGAINTLWYLPKFGHNERRIACSKLTGEAMVARGLAQKYMEGKKVRYRLTDNGLEVALIMKRRREAQQRETE